MHVCMFVAVATSTHACVHVCHGGDKSLPHIQHMDRENGKDIRDRAREGEEERKSQM